MHTNINTHKQA